jgi:hypothetical protein
MNLENLDLDYFSLPVDTDSLVAAGDARDQFKSNSIGAVQMGKQINKVCEVDTVYTVVVILNE